MRIRRNLRVLCVVLGMMVSLCGCGEKSTDVSKMSEENFDATKAFSIEDIDWVVEENIFDGVRTVTLDYTNNTGYTILEVEIDYVLKDGVTSKELAVFDEVKEELEWTDEDVAELYIYSNNRKCAEPGEHVEGYYSYINGLAYVDNMEQMAVMERDIMEICFVGPGDKAYTIYYDFRNDEFSEASSSPRQLHQWSQYEISDKLPTMDFVEVELASDDEDRVHYHAYGVTNEDYNAYKDAVIAAGYVSDVFETDDSYDATNTDGYEIDLYHYPHREDLSICITAPDR
ncbi:MAG: hypothetical protein IKL53_12245 [Lachnospiraceae bacterium]|nr:hypothetical protein [Lachnospiraceae bacterium]